MGLLSELRKVLPEGRVDTGEDELKRHGGGFFTYHAPHLPDAVVSPRSREEVLDLLRFADEHGVPVVPFGQGSSLEGHTISVRGGLSLDLNGMGEILEIRPDDFVVRVQPGVTHGKLNAALKEHGDSLPFMLGIKRLADPNGIMNPGKIFASTDGVRELSGEFF